MVVLVVACACGSHWLLCLGGVVDECVSDNAGEEFESFGFRFLDQAFDEASDLEPCDALHELGLCLHRVVGLLLPGLEAQAAHLFLLALTARPCLAALAFAPLPR